VLLSIVLCDGPNTRPEVIPSESICDREAFTKRRSWPTRGCRAVEEIKEMLKFGKYGLMKSVLFWNCWQCKLVGCY